MSDGAEMYGFVKNTGGKRLQNISLSCIPIFDFH